MNLELIEEEGENEHHNVSISGTRKLIGRGELQLALLNLFLYISSIKRPASILEELL